MSSPPSRACQDHSNASAVALCTSCNRTLCDTCFRFRLDDRPACARCAYESATRPQRRIALAIAFLCCAWGGGFWSARHLDLWADNAVALLAGAAAALVGAVLLGLSARDATQATVENREPAPDEVIEGAFEGNSTPYRARVRRVLLAASPRLSGQSTVLVLGASLVATAVLLPVSFKLPRWIEAEIVLVAWWILVAMTLVVLLYRGFRLRDDWVYFSPWNRPAAASSGLFDGLGKRSKSPGEKSSSGCSDGIGCDPGGCGDLGGCGEVAAVGLALVVALGAAWVFVEIAAPLAFFLLYALLMRAIGRVANDQHGCEGHLGRALGWGVLWATIYVLPIAGVTWALHAAMR